MAHAKRVQMLKSLHWVQRLKLLLGAEYDVVSTAFLEFAEPSLEQSIKASIEEGVKHIIVLPYFLASGNHVTRDIPTIVEEMETMYPEVNIELKAHLGSMKAMATLLSSMAH